MKKFENKVRVKLIAGKEIRVVLSPLTYAELVCKIQVLFGSKLSVPYQIYYKDREGDVILVANQEGYEAAIMQAKEGIKLFITDKTEGDPEFVLIKKKGDFEVDDSQVVLPGEELEKHNSSFEMVDASDLEERKENSEIDMDKYFEQIKEIIKEEMSSKEEKEKGEKMNDLLNQDNIRKYVEKLKGANDKCYVCGASLKMTLKFHCLVCPQYFLCGHCEERYGHEHPLLKVPGEGSKEEPIRAKVYVDTLRAKFLNTNYLKEFHVAAKSTLEIKWSIKNEGTSDWPSDTRFGLVNGHLLKYDPVKIGSIKAGSITNFVTKFTAPDTFGKFISSFQLLHGSATKFGPRARLTFQVSKPDEGPKSLPAFRQEMIKLGVPKYMENNMIKLKETYPDTDSLILFALLQKHKNNLQEAADAFFATTIKH